MPDWITTAEAAQISGYTLYHIRDLLYEGKIKGQKFSRSWQVDRESLLAYIAQVANVGQKRGPKPKEQDEGLDT